jgi:hypothetical protein
MARLESRGRAAGLAVLVGDCLPLAEGELAFAPIVAALRSVMLDPEVRTRLEPALRAALGALWPVAGSEPPRPGDREQLFEAIYRVLAGLAARQPVPAERACCDRTRGAHRLAARSRPVAFTRTASSVLVVDWMTITI